MRLAFLLLTGWLLVAGNAADVRLLKWDRGIAIQSRSQPDIAMCVWFYEWNMFDAVSPGEHTPRNHNFPIEAAQDGSKAVSTAPAIRLTAQARPFSAPAQSTSTASCVKRLTPLPVTASLSFLTSGQPRM